MITSSGVIKELGLVHSRQNQYRFFRGELWEDYFPDIPIFFLVKM